MKRTFVLAALAALAMGAIAFAQGQNPSLAELLDQFQTTNFSRQLEVGKQIANLGDVGALPVLESWLTHEDRHLRGNAALVFASLGDGRGFFQFAVIHGLDKLGKHFWVFAKLRSE